MILGDFTGFQVSLKAASGGFSCQVTIEGLQRGFKAISAGISGVHGGCMGPYRLSDELRGVLGGFREALGEL